MQLWHIDEELYDNCTSGSDVILHSLETHVFCDLKILGADKQVLIMQAFSRAHLQICKKGIVLQLN